MAEEWAGTGLPRAGVRERLLQLFDVSCGPCKVADSALPGKTPAWQYLRMPACMHALYVLFCFLTAASL
jgi:hypothetical protein